MAKCEDKENEEGAEAQEHPSQRHLRSAPDVAQFPTGCGLRGRSDLQRFMCLFMKKHMNLLTVKFCNDARA